MSTFNLRIYAADNIFFEGECEHIMLPTDDGLYGILSNHRNTIAAVSYTHLTLPTILRSCRSRWSPYH